MALRPHRCGRQDTVVSGSGPRAGGDRTIARTGENLPETIVALVRHVAGLSGGRSRKELGSTQSSAGCPVHTADPECFFCAACLLARLNETERALELLSVAVDQGYRCHYALSCHPWLDSLRSHPRFKELANRAEVLGLQARTVFLDNEGDRLLGVGS